MKLMPDSPKILFIARIPLKIKMEPKKGENRRSKNQPENKN